MIEINSKREGAELTSIKFNGKEMLYQGGAWNRHAPILFPIVGRLKNDETIINGKVYHMKQHRFCKRHGIYRIRKNQNLS